jgi:putative NADPH-quinone reductase
MTTQLLMFHDRPERSRTNRVLLDAVGAIQDITITDMGALYKYPNEIDVDIESARLLSADRLFLQFPIHWYSTPVLLKAWQDQVLTRMYYIDTAQGEQLNNLPFMVCATAGNFESAYTADGTNGYPLEDLLRPLQATAHRCGWIWADPFLLYRSNKMDDAELGRAAEDYARRVAQWSSVERSAPVN